jgi:peptidoglycan/LPS O-acetylase OafA/YrhL
MIFVIIGYVVLVVVGAELLARRVERPGVRLKRRGP